MERKEYKPKHSIRYVIHYDERKLVASYDGDLGIYREDVATVYWERPQFSCQEYCLVYGLLLCAIGVCIDGCISKKRTKTNIEAALPKLYKRADQEIDRRIAMGQRSQQPQIVFIPAPSAETKEPSPKTPLLSTHASYGAMFQHSPSVGESEKKRETQDTPTLYQPPQ